MLSKEEREKIDDEKDFHNGNDNLVVVGIGASAGGLEALRLLFPNLSLEANMTYVIAQHLDPTHRSMLVQLLARSTTMKVVEVQDGQKAKANTIYITPPDNNVNISKGILHLSKPSTGIGPKPSVDYFFTSLAEDKGEKAVGIILSGTGSDGSHGIRAIKAEGGITIVQDENTAKYNGMPHAAIETGHVDLVLPPEKIGPELLSIIKYPHIKPLSSRYEKAPDNLQQIFAMLLRRHGCDFSDYKPTTINRRIERRMAVNKLDKLEDYVRYLSHSVNELDLLYKDILISVTGFFRDIDAFKALDLVIPKIIESKKNGKSNIRVWVPGCATGEEAYSIAILFAEKLVKNINQYNIQIFGTDIDNDAIVRARKAVYSQASVVDVDKKILERYFVRQDNMLQVSKSIREMVVFARQDLVKDPPFSHLDLVSCRNVLIYFNTNLQRRIIPIFHYSLNQGGYLFLGKSESIGQLDDLFIPVNKKWKIYKRRGYFKTPLAGFNAPFVNRKTHAYQRPYPPEKELSVKDVFNQAIADNYGPPGVVINERLEIVHIKGDVNPYLNLVPGDMDFNILNMAMDELRIELRTLIHKSSREKSRVQSKKLKITHENMLKLITLDIQPLPTKRDGEPLTAILFEEDVIKDQEVIKEAAAAESETDSRIIELEQELTAAKEHLQTTVEELETANEELQSMNEELQSANEELQSSNEELETSNEELQSTNEELITVNEELQVKSAELASAYSDLQNIQNRINIALVVVDKNYKITRFTQAATNIFNIGVENIGHTITTVGCCITLPNLLNHLKNVIRKGKTIEKEFNSEDNTYWMQIYPYYSEHDIIAGAIVMFIDKTDIKKAEIELRQREERFEMIQKTAGIAIWDWNLVTNDFHGSTQFTSIVGLGENEFKGTYDDLLNVVHPEDLEYVKNSFDECRKQKIDCSIEHRIVLPDGSIRWIRESSYAVSNENNKVTRMVGIIEDISELILTKEKIVQEKQLLNAIEDKVCIVDKDYKIISANSAFLNAYGSESEVAGKHCYEVIHDSDAPCENPDCVCSFKNIIDTKTPTSYEHVHTRKDGIKKCVRVCVSPILNAQGKVEKFIHISKDLKCEQDNG